MKADHTIDSVTGRDDFNFKTTIIDVTEKEFTDRIFMLTKLDSMKNHQEGSVINYCQIFTLT